MGFLHAAGLFTSIFIPVALTGKLFFPEHKDGFIVREDPRTTHADIRADSNRDGAVDMVGDLDLIEAKYNWTEDAGAIFLPSIGDQGGKCSMKLAEAASLVNEELDVCNDASGYIQYEPDLLAPIKTMPIHDLSDSAWGTVSVRNETARELVRIFRKTEKHWLYVEPEYKFAKDDLEAGLDLGIDARDVRRPGWDGLVTVEFRVFNSTGLYWTDSVVLRVAPVLTHHPLQRVDEVLAVGHGFEDPLPYQLFNDRLSELVKNAGISKGPSFLEGFEDLWLQDYLEAGYSSMPGPDGTLISIRIMIRPCEDDREAGKKVFTQLRGTRRGAVQHLGGNSQGGLNGGGNLETVPPYSFNGTNWPAGRVVLGKHNDSIPHIHSFFRAQESQEPLLLEAGWLRTGHIDEFLQFLPAKNKRGWVAAVDDPKYTLEFLQSLKSEGHGQIPLFSHSHNTSATDFYHNATVESILADEELMDHNQMCVRKINSNIEILKKELGLEDSEIIRVPALYTPETIESKVAGKVMALIPSMINNLVLSGYSTCIAPNPWGPAPNGTDVLAKTVKDAYSKEGITVEYIDTWETYHGLGGGVHCATNSIREISGPWWQT